MKTLASLLLAAVLLPTCLADDISLDDALRTPADQAEEFLDMIRTQVETLKAINLLLPTIRDRASADAAAPKLAPLMKTFNTLLAAGQGMQVTVKRTPELEALHAAQSVEFRRFLMLGVDLSEKDYYGSDALRQAVLQRPGKLR